MKRKSSLIFSILLAVLLLLSCKGKSAASKTSARKPSEPVFSKISEIPDSEEIQQVRKLLSGRKWIIHAGGYMQEASGRLRTYTNSKEALENCLAKGNSVCELDFRISSDGYLVCTHEWDMMSRNGKPIPDSAITKDEFLQCRTRGNFSPMWLDDLVEFLKIHPDFYFITDIKDDNVQACKLLSAFLDKAGAPGMKDHFIIQIYHAKEYDFMRELGFRNIIFTLYCTTPSERTSEKLLDFAQNHELVGYTYWFKFTDIYLEKFLAAGIPSFIHTVNEKDEREAFLQNGVAAIYTDEVEN